MRLSVPRSCGNGQIVKTKKMDKRQWVVYLIRCSDESLYCGITNNLKNRVETHNSGRGSKYTRSRRPVELVGASSKMTKSDALKLEYRVKQVPAGKKIFELTIREDKTTMDLKKDLQAVNKEIKALSKKVERLIIAVDQIEAGKPVKKVAAKKPVKLTTIDTVFAIIKRSGKGIDTRTLVEKTGFNNAHIHNIVSKLKKQGKVKTAGRGVYMKA